MRFGILFAALFFGLGCGGAFNTPTSTGAPTGDAPPESSRPEPVPSKAFLVVQEAKDEKIAKVLVDGEIKANGMRGDYPLIVPPGTIPGGPWVAYAAPANEEVAKALAGKYWEVHPVDGWPHTEVVDALVVDATNAFNKAKRDVVVTPRTPTGCGLQHPVVTAGGGARVPIPQGADLCLIARTRLPGGPPDCLILTALTPPVTHLTEARFWCQDDAAKTGKAPSIPYRAMVMVDPDAGTMADPEWNANHEWVLAAVAPYGVAVDVTEDAKVVLRPDLTVDLDEAFPDHSNDGFLLYADGKPPKWVAADDADHVTLVAAVHDQLGADVAIE